MRHLPYLARLKASRHGRSRLAAPAALIAGAALASPAFASTGTGTMPWDNILTTVQTDLTGPVATAIGVACCIIFGLSMAWGHEGSAMKRGMSILFGLAIAFTSASGLIQVFGGGTGAIF